MSESTAYIQAAEALAKKQDALNAASELLRVLSNRHRLNIMCHIAQGELNVGEIEMLTQIHQPTLSQQLTILRSGGLVKTRRDGKQIYYKIASRESLVIIKTLQELYNCENN